MNILDKIVFDKKLEIAAKQKMISVDYLKDSPLFNRRRNSLKEALIHGTGIIAEHKRKSPSKSIINQISSVREVIEGYDKANVSGMSILTDTKYFGGAIDDLIQARSFTNKPLLRKDFMIDAYQFYEAKAFGADVVLLIASILNPNEIKTFSTLAQELSLDVLLEVHDEEELERSICDTVDMIGVNNRDLKNFTVSIENSKRLSSKIPNSFVKVSESGISSIAAINELKPFGYKGFLIGENFMKTESPAQSAIDFINKL